MYSDNFDLSNFISILQKFIIKKHEDWFFTIKQGAEYSNSKALQPRGEDKLNPSRCTPHVVVKQNTKDKEIFTFFHGAEVYIL